MDKRLWEEGLKLGLQAAQPKVDVEKIITNFGLRVLIVLLLLLGGAFLLASIFQWLVFFEAVHPAVAYLVLGLIVFTLCSLLYIKHQEMKQSMSPPSSSVKEVITFFSALKNSFKDGWNKEEYIHRHRTKF